MSTKRIDAWEPHEDAVLVKTVIACVASGGTQLKAFEEAADSLGRTPEACRFRWNGVLRHQLEDHVKEAKKIGYKNRKRKRKGCSVQESFEKPCTSSTLELCDIDPTFTGVTKSLQHDLHDILNMLKGYQAGYSTSNKTSLVVKRNAVNFKVEIKPLGSGDIEDWIKQELK